MDWNLRGRHWLSVIGLGLLLLSGSLSATDSDTLPATEAPPLFDWQQQSDGRLQLAIPPLASPMLLVTSLPYGVGSNEIGLDRGQLGSRRLVQFERHGEQLLLRQLNTQYRGQSDHAAEVDAVTRAFAQSVLWIGPIQDERVDLTSLVLADWHGIGARLKQRGQGTYTLSGPQSLLLTDAVRAFPNNADVDVQLTFVGAEPGAQLHRVAADPHNLSVRVRYSFIALPEQPMAPRRFHPQSGFFPYQFVDYSKPLSQPMQVQYLPRHRLEKVTPGAARSAVVEPIVYYLDPGTPEPVRSALLDGARWWTEAFEAAGFIDAFRVELLPEDADPQDMRYNLIQWVHRATRGWSYGDSVIDPRSGEILKGHVTLGSLRVRQDHKIFRALTAGWQDRDAALAAAEQAALARLRQLSAHEVGHTLGLAHNFAASASGDKSVMDYPHPDLRLTQDQVDLRQAYQTGLSPWDRFAVAFGYGDYPGPEASSQQALIAQAKQQGLSFISDPDARGVASAHPDAHLWDNGTDPVAQLQSLMALRRHALATLSTEALLPGEANSAFAELLVPVYLLHRYQAEATSKLLGGVEYDYSGTGRSWLAPEWQRAAMSALLTLLEPEALALPERVRQQWVPLSYGSRPTREQFQGRQGVVPDLLGLAEIGSRVVLTPLLNGARLNRMLEQQWLEPELPGPSELLAELSQRLLLASVEDGLDGAIQSRVRSVLIDAQLALYHDAGVAPEVRSLILAQLRSDAEQLDRRARRAESRIGAHYKMLAQVIRDGLDDPSVRMIAEPLPVPPGSPI
ncbi:zinc-dependent metalloprotease [Ferrimonas pelagia]|uniref:Zinc-dependent metalloprotease n=1 Tax=Ferrimonas pelagia TaxID=1177826 RepID=A0ABP9EWZ5_9GAMM